MKHGHCTGTKRERSGPTPDFDARQAEGLAGIEAELARKQAAEASHGQAEAGAAAPPRVAEGGAGMALILTEQEEALWLPGGWQARNIEMDLRERVWRHQMDGIIRVDLIDGERAFYVDSLSGEVF